MKVTVVMPAYNAADTLKSTYDAIPKACADEVILVDDASQDNTINEARKIPELIVIGNKKNKGYGGNQKVCYREALRRGADIVVMLHPDFQYDPARIPEMTDIIKNGEADMVLGSRFLREDPRSGGMPWWRYYGNRFLTTVQNTLMGASLAEWHTGYRAYTAEALRNIPYEKFSDSFVFDSQMLITAVKMRMRIKEVTVPTRYLSDSSSISFSSSVKYGIATLGALFLKNR